MAIQFCSPLLDNRRRSGSKIFGWLDDKVCLPFRCHQVCPRRSTRRSKAIANIWNCAPCQMELWVHNAWLVQQSNPHPPTTPTAPLPRQQRIVPAAQTLGNRQTTFCTQSPTPVKPSKLPAKPSTLPLKPPATPAKTQEFLSRPGSIQIITKLVLSIPLHSRESSTTRTEFSSKLRGPQSCPSVIQPIFMSTKPCRFSKSPSDQLLQTSTHTGYTHKWSVLDDCTAG